MPERDRRSDPALAGGGLEPAAEQLHEHALAGAVLSDHAHTLPAEDGEVDAGQDAAAAQLPGDVSQLAASLAAALLASQAKAHLPAFEHRPVDLVHPVDSPLHVAGRLDVPLVDDDVRPVAEPAERPPPAGGTPFFGVA